MEYCTLLFFGCIIGMQHALEADHLAAVAALTVKHDSRRALVLRGCIWGLGHTVTLLTICGALLLLGEAISPRIEAALELAVGAMVAFLGVNALYIVWRRRPHFHVHQHGQGMPHLHVHSHAGESVPHEQSRHDHSHCELGLRRALIVGMMHGAAGSAGLLVLAAATGSAVQSVGYVAAFGIGSIAGMTALSFVAAYPIKYVEQYANWANTAAFACIGLATLVIGGNLIGESWNSL